MLESEPRGVPVAGLQTGAIAMTTTTTTATTQSADGRSDAVPHVCGARLDRRAFLHRTGLAIAAAMVATGLTPGEGFASAVSELTPLSRTARTRTYPIPATDGVFVDVPDSVVLARWQGKIYAFSIECPHRGAKLQWHAAEGMIYCPKHKARFSPNGDHVSGRRTGPLDRFALRRAGSTTVIALDQVLTADQDAAAWAAAVLAV